MEENTQNGGQAMTKSPGGLNTELIDIIIKVEYEREKSVLVINDQGHKCFLPKSLIEFEPSGNHPNIYQITLPRWLAEEKGLS
jgi:hypothetical protein